MKLLHDWVLVKLDPIPADNITPGGLVLVEPAMVRTGVVMQTGPGKHYKNGPFIPIGVKIGERVSFLAGNMDTKNGRRLQCYIEEDEALIPETAIWFVIELDDGEAIPRVTK